MSRDTPANEELWMRLRDTGEGRKGAEARSRELQVLVAAVVIDPLCGGGRPAHPPSRIERRVREVVRVRGTRIGRARFGPRDSSAVRSCLGGRCRVEAIPAVRLGKSKHELDTIPCGAVVRTERRHLMVGAGSAQIGRSRFALKGAEEER